MTRYVLIISGLVPNMTVIILNITGFVVNINNFFDDIMPLF